MFTNKQNIQTALPPAEKISVLLVSPHADDHAALEQILQHGAWNVSLCTTTSEALPLIRSHSPVLIVCEHELSDGNWKTVLAACEASTHPPLVLVTSRHADETLWAEVLNLGGYDVLLKPFDRREVTRVLGMASRHWFGRAAKQPVGSASANFLSAQFA
jgi:DNA-binding response OmpR family regulator